MRKVTIRFAGQSLGVAWIVACVSGCAIGEKKNGTPEFPALSGLDTPESRADLEEKMKVLMAFAENEIVSAADRIEAETEDPAARRAALLWKVGVLKFEHELLGAGRAPASEFFEGWSFLVRQKSYFTTGAGAQLFADQQPIAINAISRVYGRVDRVARDHFPEDRYEELSRFVDEHARKNPIQPIFSYEIGKSLAEEAEKEGLFAKVFGRPLAALGKASKDALDPTSRLAESVDNFNELMADYPSMVRWQTQLLWWDMQESRSVQTTVAGIDDVASSSVRLATVAEQLPQRVREEVQIAFQDVIENQEDLRRTVREARETVDATTAALQRAEVVSASIERSLAHATRAGEVWERTAGAVTETVKQIQVWTPKKEAASPGAAPPPATGQEGKKSKFDINDYTQTAEALTVATEELRALFAEARAFLDDDTLQEDLAQVNALTASTAGEARALVDHIAWRGVQLCGLIFLLALVYRFVPGRRAKSAAA